MESVIFGGFGGVAGLCAAPVDGAVVADVEKSGVFSAGRISDSPPTP